MPSIAHANEAGPAAAVGAKVLIAGHDASLDAVAAKLEEAGLRVRVVPAERAVETAWITAPDLVVALGDAARDGGIALRDELLQEPASAALPLLVICASQFRPDRGHGHVATLSPILGARRIAPVLINLAQELGDVATRQERDTPMPLRGRVSAALHHAERQMALPSNPAPGSGTGPSVPPASRATPRSRSASGSRPVSAPPDAGTATGKSRRPGLRSPSTRSLKAPPKAEAPVSGRSPSQQNWRAAPGAPPPLPHEPTPRRPVAGAPHTSHARDVPTGPGSRQSSSSGTLNQPLMGARQERHSAPTIKATDSQEFARFAAALSDEEEATTARHPIPDADAKASPPPPSASIPRPPGASAPRPPSAPTTPAATDPEDAITWKEDEWDTADTQPPSSYLTSFAPGHGNATAPTAGGEFAMPVIDDDIDDMDTLPPRQPPPEAPPLVGQPTDWLPETMRMDDAVETLIASVDGETGEDNDLAPGTFDHVAEVAPHVVVESMPAPAMSENAGGGPSAEANGPKAGTTGSDDPMVIELGPMDRLELQPAGASRTRRRRNPWPARLFGVAAMVLATMMVLYALKLQRKARPELAPERGLHQVN